MYIFSLLFFSFLLKSEDRIEWQILKRWRSVYWMFGGWNRKREKTLYIHRSHSGELFDVILQTPYSLRGNEKKIIKKSCLNMCRRWKVFCKIKKTHPQKWKKKFFFEAVETFSEIASEECELSILCEDGCKNGDNIFKGETKTATEKEREKWTFH